MVNKTITNKHGWMDGYKHCLHLLSVNVSKFIYLVVFDNMQQQDAHEFLNYLLNTVADLLVGMSPDKRSDISLLFLFLSS